MYGLEVKALNDHSIKDANICVIVTVTINNQKIMEDLVESAPEGLFFISLKNFLRCVKNGEEITAYA